MYTGYWISEGGHIYGPDGYTRCWISDGHIHSSAGYTRCWISDGHIHSPTGYTQCWIADGGHIYGPKENLPWS
jgi:hypothetical protein